MKKIKYDDLRESYQKGDYYSHLGEKVNRAFEAPYQDFYEGQYADVNCFQKKPKEGEDEEQPVCQSKAIKDGYTTRYSLIIAITGEKLDEDKTISGSMEIEVEAVEGGQKPTMMGKKYEKLYEKDLIY